ncbi:MAG TPA: Ppx/GppA phosphatase family protein [bacterium]|nr:Ppx/GppA phosphatase family protein [bacterium]
MKLASIDIGTNSVLLLIAELDKRRLTPIRSEVYITRLGQGVDKTQRLHPEAVERTVAILSDYAEICSQHDLSHIIVAGTSALRDAANGEAFLRRVKDSLGWDIRILTGEDEASLTFTATQYEFNHLEEHYLVLDIGGGSTEFMYGDNHACRFFKSLNIGSVRFTEQYFTQDPPARDILQQVRKRIRHEMSSHLQSLSFDVKDTVLIGVAGTVTTLLAVEKQMAQYDPAQIHRQPLMRSQVEHLLEEFLSRTLEERKQLPGLQPGRADVIIAGTLILLETMQVFGFDKLLVSDRGTRYGLLYEYMQSGDIPEHQPEC